MNAISASRKLERSEQVEMLRRHGTPLPQQGEGEGEVASGAKLDGHNVDGSDFAVVKPAINNC